MKHWIILVTIFTLLPASADILKNYKQLSSDQLSSNKSSNKQSYDQRILINKKWGLIATIVQISKRAPIRFKLQDAPTRKENDNVLHYWDKNKHTIIVNGAYFDKNFSPVGYYKINDEVINKTLSPTLSGIVGISKFGKISLLKKQELAQNKHLPTLMQAGPYIIDPNGKPGIRHNNFKRYQRTVIAKTKSGDTLFVSTAPISLYDLSRALKEELPNIERALNLDGGPSSALVTSKTTIQNRMPVRNYLIGFN